MLTLLPFPYHNFDAASKFSIMGTEPNTFYSLNDYVSLQKNGNSKQFDLYIMSFPSGLTLYVGLNLMQPSCVFYDRALLK